MKTDNHNEFNSVNSSAQADSADNGSSVVKTSQKAEDADGKKTKKRNHHDERVHAAVRWIIIITITSLALSFCFSLGTELVVTKAGLIVSIVLLVILIALSIICDAMGVAITSSDTAPFAAMASKKVKGSRHAIAIIKNSDRYSSIFNDVIGDVCGIVSGACGASIAIMIAAKTGGEMWVSIIAAAIIAALTIGGKAAMKTVAIKNNVKFVLFLGKLIALIKKEKK